MDREKVGMLLRKTDCVLDLKRKIVGVKFLFTPEEFAQAEARGTVAPIHYCAMVKAASTGHGVKAAAEHFACLGGARALGAVEPDETNESGRSYLNLGLYQDLTIAKQAFKQVTRCRHKLYGVMVKPLEQFAVAPDVVIFIGNSYAAMRIVQGYTYAYGIQPAFKLSGNQAICSECTAYPFESNNINISMLCGGTRHKAGWGEEEIAIGLPFNRFSAVAEGILATVNAMEPNGNKKRIEAKLQQHGVQDLVIEYDNAYFLRKRAGK